jgi:cell division protein FtsL
MRALIIVMLIAATWGSALAVVQVSQQTRELHTTIHRLNQQHSALAIEEGRLMLEQGALAAPMLLERQALGLGFRAPAPSQLYIMPEVSR